MKWYLRHIRDHEYSDEYPKDYFRCDICDENDMLIISEFDGTREQADRIVEEHNELQGIEDVAGFMEDVYNYVVKGNSERRGELLSVIMKSMTNGSELFPIPPQDKADKESE